MIGRQKHARRKERDEVKRECSCFAFFRNEIQNGTNRMEISRIDSLVAKVEIMRIFEVSDNLQQSQGIDETGLHKTHLLGDFVQRKIRPLNGPKEFNQMFFILLSIHF